MNDVIKCLVERRSIKSFQSKMVEDEKINEIVKAGMYAPTAMNLQSPNIIVITNEETKKEIRNKNCEIMGNYNIDPFHNAPVIILVIAKNTPTAVYDGSCVIDNMLNAAYSLGLGACWIHRAKEEMESDFGKKILAKLRLEGDYVGIGHVAVGYPEGDIPKTKPRKENYVYYIK